MLTFKEFLSESKFISTADNPILEIGNVLELYDEISKDRYKISSLANVFYYKSKEERLKYVVNDIFNFGFERYPVASSSKAQKLVRDVFKDTDLLDKKETDKEWDSYFIKKVVNTNKLISSGKIEGWEFIVDALL